MSDQEAFLTKTETQELGEQPVQSRVESVPEVELGQWWWVKDPRTYTVVLPDGEAGEAGADEDEDEEAGADEAEDDDEAEADEIDDDDGCYTAPKPKNGKGKYEGDDGQGSDLGCVMEIGSNYVEVGFPRVKGHATIRVHFREWYGRCRREKDPEAVLSRFAEEARERMRQLMVKVNEATAALGVGTQAAGTTALAVASGQRNMEKYQESLELAHKTTLPALFAEIKSEAACMGMWLSARTLPLLGRVGLMEGALGEIKGRIFNVQLYAGLTEEIAQVKEGKPAAPSERLRIHQRRLYMDEEALIAYRHGGMEFADIKAFDRWLAKRENMERILHFERCMVAFRVRRVKKYRPGLHPFVACKLDNADKLTFLYFRNGQNLYRMSTELEFDAKLFPAASEMDMSEAVMVYTGGSDNPSSSSSERSKSLKTLPVRSWEARRDEELERRRQEAVWDKKNPFKKWKVQALKVKRKERADKLRAKRREVMAARAKKGEAPRACRPLRFHGEPDVHHWDWQKANPFHRDSLDGERFSPESWAPFNETYIYYDECVATIKRSVEYYNRIVWIVQGLFDRSEVFHPHPSVQLWNQEGFAAAVELVYDSAGLYDGARPDFQAYAAELMEEVDETCVLLGQEDYWQHDEAKKRSAKDHRFYGEHHEPDGNPGPGELARPTRLGKKGATFTWDRERQRGKAGWSRKTGRYEVVKEGSPIKTTITVPLNKLFNVSAYKPGDFLQFFRDPRTREEYLDWAPLLLTAEEWHAAGRVLGAPGKSSPIEVDLETETRSGDGDEDDEA